MTGKLSKNFHGVGIGPLSKILAVKEKVMGLNPGYLLKSFLLYQTEFLSIDICKEARKRNFLNLIYQAFLKKLWRFYAFLIRPPCRKGRVIMLRHLPEHSATPWVRSTKNVKKPHRQMCGPWRKAWFKIFAKQNRNIFGFSHTFDSEVYYCTKWVLTNKQN